MTHKKITSDEVGHVARLARLAMSETELATYGSQLDGILGYVAKLNEIDTSGVQPTAHVISLATPYREDEPGVSFTHEEILANAPVRQEFYFQVPQVIE
ncbi:MAG: Asp-tRNA(Asn)/Glu-tRNA(Gln) amidotransferase subunit GatC [Deltaproteobacteria bacterium]|nr:Asp-tRNA(Asn)/Glu-tRNA(Gln) amidotransferase subunit GatC [Candidatus Anaeroferrophillus wilburensis]MBN2889224.1 Asp-tRNA(Asn)/Glu-tRNA(Gln) amidotransferase subunit GatC [Deltaproteobacteria bacterium]